MSTEETILLWQTIGIWVAVVAAPATIVAMFRQTKLASRLAHEARRQECLETLLSVYRAAPLQSGRAYYAALNRVPVLFAFDALVLKQYRTFRDLSVQKDLPRARVVFKELLLLMAASCGLPLAETDLDAALGVQWADPR